MVSKRAKFLRILKDSIEIKLLQWVGIDKSALSTLNDDFIFAGSALLAIMNREFWLPEDVDLWIKEYPSDVILSRLHLAKSFFHDQSPGVSGEWGPQYPKNFKMFYVNYSRKQHNVGYSIPINLLNVRFLDNENKNSLGSFGETIVKNFDLEFLHMYYDGRKLHIFNLQNIVNRNSKHFSNANDNGTFRLVREETRINKYRKRNFTIDQQAIEKS